MDYQFPLRLLAFGYNEQNNRPLMKQHKHFTCEFYYITKGNATITVYNEKTEKNIDIFENQITLIRPGVEHSINSRSTIHYFVLEVALADSDTDIIRYLSSTDYVRQFKEWDILKNKWKDILVINDTQNVAEIFNAFRTLSTLSEPFKTAHFEILLKRLFLALLRCEVPELNTRGQNIHVRYAMSFILSKFNEGISAKDVAEQSKISLAHLQRLFRQTFNATITDKINEAKVHYASQLLVSSHYPLYQVAKQSGFHSMQHFDSVFKKTVGLSPGEYRTHFNKKIHRETYIDSTYTIRYPQ